MSDEKKLDPRDIAVGRSVAKLRGDMTQAVLAQHMRDLGWKWSQATVWAVERGERPLRLNEAKDLLEVLDAPGIFLRDLGEDRLTVRYAIQSASRAREDTLEHLVAYLEARDKLALNLDPVVEVGASGLSAMDVFAAQEVLRDSDSLEELAQDVAELRRERLAADGNFAPDDRVLAVGDERIEGAKAARERLRAVMDAESERVAEWLAQRRQEVSDGEHPEAP